ncbi:gp16 family protein [Phaeobacter sp. 11ANDIMAR09]|uniref:gp16 family protein n=1 Tax=Phaeobacter sp. 11ANDIMAR09 TaxID=1225647 RepID=UPI0006C8973D|nr:regulatory protein GemA [Phaeobacter sp. 11ANDIMAR09]KPD10883.1 Rha family transcriptional regulator [Phaeobacter sp. 11ANDIMAR09]
MTRALQQKIHVGCRELGLDADARRELQLVVTGKASMKDMDEAELNAVLKRLKQDGFQASSNKKKHPKASRPDLRLVHVLWGKLGEANKLRDPSRKGLNKFIRERFGKAWSNVPADVDMMRDHKEIDQVIQALKSWGQRVDIDFDWEAHQR